MEESPEDDLPHELRAWLERHGASEVISQSTPVVYMDYPRRRYVLATVRLKDLIGDDSFTRTDYNPREPDPRKTRDLQASITLLSMLSPLTCAFVDKTNRDKEDKKEHVILIDGRHRFEALKLLAKDTQNKRWLDETRIDMKVFFGLSKSDMHVLATYLNRTRRALKKGEYFRAIVKIYEKKETELHEATGKPATEEEIFEAVNPHELTDRNYDLSIGRIVGLTAFAKEEGDSWNPFVGVHQADRIDEENHEFFDYYCPLTANNMGLFLRDQCRVKPYGKEWNKRDMEIGNVVRLGRLFNKIVFTHPLSSRGKFTDTTVSCKSWCISSLGSLMARAEILQNGEEESLLSREDIDWTFVEGLLKEYMKIMEEQAGIVTRYYAEQQLDRKMDLYNRAWSHQTEKAIVTSRLQIEFENRRGFKFKSMEK